MLLVGARTATVPRMNETATEAAHHIEYIGKEKPRSFFQDNQLNQDGKDQLKFARRPLCNQNIET